MSRSIRATTQPERRELPALYPYQQAFLKQLAEEPVQKGNLLLTVQAGKAQQTTQSTTHLSDSGEA